MGGGVAVGVHFALFIPCFVNRGFFIMPFLMGFGRFGFFYGLIGFIGFANTKTIAGSSVH